MEPDLISTVTTAPLSLIIDGKTVSPDSPRDVVYNHEVIQTCENTFTKQVIVTRLTEQMRELQTNIRDV